MCSAALLVPWRRQYVELTESVREQGSVVHVFSSQHVTGQQLSQLSGIACILRFPAPSGASRALDLARRAITSVRERSVVGEFGRTRAGQE